MKTDTETQKQALIIAARRLDHAYDFVCSAEMVISAAFDKVECETQVNKLIALQNLIHCALDNAAVPDVGDDTQ